MDKTTHPYFVADGESRTDTAILLVGTAREYGISQRDVRAVRGGFRISQAMADVLYDEQEPAAQSDSAPVSEAEVVEEEVEAEQPATKKTTAKKTATKKTATKKASTRSTRTSTDEE